MQTVITKKIDGYDIIVGFGSLSIEAVETEKKAKPLIEKTDEAKAVKVKGKELSAIAKEYSDAVKAAKEAFKNGNASLHSQHIFTAGQKEEKMKTVQAELVDLIHAEKEKYAEIWMENVVYHEPKAGEIVLEDNSLVELYLALGKKELLCLDGTVIKDNRGVKYIKEGKVLTVDTLGAEPDGPLMESVTPEEFEAMRIASLTEAEKAKELASITDGLAEQAASMRSKLEIQGDADALAKAQAWYKEQVAAAEEKYAQG